MWEVDTFRCVSGCRFQLNRRLLVTARKAVQSLGSFSAPPKELILDFDRTDDRVHGAQVGGAFHVCGCLPEQIVP